MCLGTQKHTDAHFHAHTYKQKSCHPNLNPIYHQTNGIFPWSRRWLACSLYASSEISEFSPALFPLCLLLSLPSYTPPSSSSSHHCAALNVLLFVYLFICCFFIWGKKGVKSQIPGTYSWLGLAAVRVIEERDRNVLIRSPRMLWRERHTAQGRRGERREERGEVEGKERGEKSLRAFDTWRLLSVRYLRV